MPFYLPLNITREQMEKKRRDNVCKVCGEFVSIFRDMDKKQYFLACHRYLINNHEGIEKEASELKMKGMSVMNIPAREEIMNEQFGEQRAVALRKYQGLTTLTKEQAKEILVTIWPGAKGPELFKAMMICEQYGLNPLMKHLYLIPFKDNANDKVNLICVMGIGANRLIASRKHTYSYIDDTPRMMTEDEEKRRYGEVDKNKLRGITKLKDIKSGAEASGYGEWPKAKEPYGTDKGNSKANMVFIRSERQALDKLYPADMPSSEIPVVDENYIEVEGHVVDESTDKAQEKPEATKTDSVNNAEPAVTATEPKTTPPRDPYSIKTLTDLYRACHEDWPNTFKSSKDVLKELGVSSQADIANTPADCYRNIASTRK